MGQTIQVLNRVVLDEVAVLDTDRTITAMDGAGFGSVAAAEEGEGLPARLAGVLFGADPEVSHVFIAANQVLLQRSGGWDEAALDAAADEVSRFLVYYRD